METEQISYQINCDHCKNFCGKVTVEVPLSVDAQRLNDDVTIGEPLFMKWFNVNGRSISHVKERHLCTACWALRKENSGLLWRDELFLSEIIELRKLQDELIAKRAVDKVNP